MKRTDQDIYDEFKLKKSFWSPWFIQNYFSVVRVRGEAGALVQWLKLPALKVEDRGFEPSSGLRVLNNQNVFPRSFVKIQYCREPPWPCSASARQDSNFELCVWKAVSAHSSHHPQEVLLAQFSLYVHKCGLKPHSFHFKLKEEGGVLVAVWQSLQLNNSSQVEVWVSRRTCHLLVSHSQRAT